MSTVTAQPKYSFDSSSKPADDASDRSASRVTDRGTTSEVKGDLTAVKQDLVKLRDDATSTAQHGAEAAKEYAKKASDHARESYESMCKFVQERPATSMMIALGVGALVSRLFAPRL
jgi:ElaB/YqjD/DUF883 family membrane-anchored ribosome-binding protein